MSIPAANTSAPPTTTCTAARQNGVGWLGLFAIAVYKTQRYEQ